MVCYPLFLNLANLSVLVAGCGRVGMRKVRSLAACGAKGIEVVEPRPHIRELDDFTATGVARHLTRTFEPGDLAGKTLVFAATNDPAVNAEITRLCAERSILCSSADNPQAGTFHTPAHFQADGLTVALSSHGQSPALAARARRELEEWFSGRYAGLANILGRLRPDILALGLEQEENARIFKAVAESSLPGLLAQKETGRAAALLRSLLPEKLHPRIDAIVKECL